MLASKVNQQVKPLVRTCPSCGLHEVKGTYQVCFKCNERLKSAAARLSGKSNLKPGLEAQSVGNSNLPCGEAVAVFNRLEKNALLLRKCWDLVGFAKDESAREALAVTLFLTETRGG